jgi:hypothetical protein
LVTHRPKLSAGSAPTNNASRFAMSVSPLWPSRNSGRVALARPHQTGRGKPLAPRESAFLVLKSALMTDVSIERAVCGAAARVFTFSFSWFGLRGA